MISSALEGRLQKAVSLVKHLLDRKLGRLDRGGVYLEKGG